MSTIKSVAVVGASGLIGQPILKALVDSGKFTVTAIKRESSQSTYAEGVKVVSADLKSVASLKEAFTGQDAVVSAVGYEGLKGQDVLIDAAVAAGVKRFLPSEFGADLDHPNAAQIPLFADKVSTAKYIKEVAAKHPEFSYTELAAGVFLDWGIGYGFILDYKSAKTPIYDNGTVPFSTTSLPTVGKAVVGVLSHPEETKNRIVFIKDLDITQKRVFELAQKVAPERQWEPVPVSTAQVEKSSYEALSQGRADMEVMFGFLIRACFANGFGVQFEKDDNALLGLPYKTEDEVEGYLRKALAGEQAW